MKRTFVLLCVGLALIVGCAAALLRFFVCCFTNPAKAWQIAIAVDDLDNVAGNGRLGQTISSRAAHARPRRWACLLCRFLDWVDPGHCDRAMTATSQNLEADKA